MTPIFRTHFSIGKSLLTPKKIKELAEQQNLTEVYVCDDNMSGFRSLIKEFKDSDMTLCLGLKLPYAEAKDGDISDVCIFAKDDDGYKELIQLMSFVGKNGYLNADDVDFFSLVKNEHLFCAYPFYSSFLAKSIKSWGYFVTFGDLQNFFVESNKHPFDFVIGKAIDKYSSDKTIIPVKTILYEKEEHFKSFQMYQANCNRKGGKKPSYHNPNLEHCCSPMFSMDDFLTSKK